MLIKSLDTLEFKISETKNSEELIELPYTKIDPKVFPKWTTRQKPSTPQSPSTPDGGNNEEDNDLNIVITATHPPRITGESGGFNDDYDNITGLIQIFWIGRSRYQIDLIKVINKKFIWLFLVYCFVI